MIKLSQIEPLLDETGIVYEEINLSLVNEDKTIIPPYIAYYQNEPSHFCADGVIWASVSNVTVELITTLDDNESEFKVEEVLRKNEIIYAKDTSYMEDASIKSVEFNFEMLDDRFDN